MALEPRYQDVLDLITKSEKKLYDIPFFAHVFNNAIQVRGKPLSINDNFQSESNITEVFKDAGLGTTRTIDAQNAFFRSRLYVIPYNDDLIPVRRVSKTSSGQTLQIFPNEGKNNVAGNPLVLTPSEIETIVASVDRHWDELKLGFVNDGAIMPTKPTGDAADTNQAERLAKEQAAAEQARIREEERLEREREEAARLKQQDEARIERERVEANRVALEKQRLLQEKENAEKQRQLAEQTRMLKEKEAEQQRKLAEEKRIADEKEALRQKLLQQQPKSVDIKKKNPKDVLPAPITPKPSTTTNTNTPTRIPTSVRPLVDSPLGHLEELRHILQGINSALLTPDNNGLARLLTAFNAVHCFEVSPLTKAPPRIEPIYLNAPKACRVRRVSIERPGYVQIVVGSPKSDAVMDFMSTEFGNYLRESLAENVPIDAVDAGLERDPSDKLIDSKENDDIVMDYADAIPVLGQIQREVSRGLGIGTPTVTWSDSSGVGALLSVKSWTVDERFVIDRNVRPVQRESGLAKLGQLDSNLLRHYIFSSSEDRSHIDAVMSRREVWTQHFNNRTTLEEQQFAEMLRTVKRQSEAIYNALVRASPSQRLETVSAELDQARRTIALLGETIKKAKTTSAQLERLKLESEIKEQYYGALLDSLTGLFNATDLTSTLVDEIDDAIDRAMQKRREALADLPALETGDSSIDSSIDNMSTVAETAFTPTMTTLQSGFEVATLNETYSNVMSTNLFKGKYSIGVSVAHANTAETLFDATLKHCNSFNPVLGQNVLPGETTRFYGAAFDKKTPQQYNHTPLDTQLDKNVIGSSGRMTISVRDEQGNLLKSTVMPFDVDLRANSDYLYLMQTEDTKIFMTRVDEDHLKLKMITINV